MDCIEEVLTINHVSAAQIEIDSLGVPTASLIDKQKAEAEELLIKKDYESAILVFSKLSDNANSLANLINKALKPWYAISDADKEWSPFYGNRFDRYISKLSELVRLRDYSTVMVGECYLQKKMYGRAAVCFCDALDTINSDDKELWGKAANGIFLSTGLPAIKL